MDTVPTWVTAISVITAALGGGLGKWFYDIYQERNKRLLSEKELDNKTDLATKQHDKEIRMAENEQAFRIYKELVDGLRQDVNRISQDMNKLENEHIHCREENASLKAEQRSQAREIENLKAQISIKVNSGESK